MIQRAVTLLAILVLVGLGACTSTTPPEVLNSAAATTQQPEESVGDVSEPNSAIALTAVPEETDTNEGGAQVAALATSTSIRLAPVIGAPSGAVQAMSRRISSRSSERGISVVPPGTSRATYDMKGYFSAITESGKTTVIFVWDVFDTSGNRLHRIQGQETAPGTSPDGWSSVSSRMMESIGARTVDEFASWLEGQKRS